MVLASPQNSGMSSRYSEVLGGLLEVLFERLKGPLGCLEEPREVPTNSLGSFCHAQRVLEGLWERHGRCPGSI